MLELVAGVLASLAAFLLVVEPLLFPRAADDGSADVDEELETLDPREMDSPKIKALVALREIEFDRATGKLSDQDYNELRATYQARALEAMRDEDRLRQKDVPSASPGDSQRATTGGCPVCSSALQPGAHFCSTCGCAVFSGGPVPRCWVCGGNVDSNASFCATCGADNKAPSAVGV